MTDTPTGHARRRFLMGAAGFAATPLVAGLAAGCTTEPTPRDTGTDEPDGDTRANAITAATTVTSRRTSGRSKVSGIGLGCQTMTGKLYGPVTSRADMITLIRAAHDQGVTFFDTAEAYGPFEVRAHRRRSGRTNPRPGGHRLQVRIRHRPGDRGATRRTQQPTRPHQDCRRRDAATAAHRPHRPALPTPGRPRRPDRGRGRHRQGPDGARESRHSGCPSRARRRFAARTRSSR